MLSKIKYWLSFCLLVITNVAVAQQPKVEMADAMRSNGKIYVVVAVASIIFAGIVVYLIIIDRKVSRLEKEIKK